MKHVPKSAYGMLLALDGYGAAPERLANTGILEAVLMTLPTRIGMRPLGLPHIVRVDEEGIRGLSGFTFIMESHISIHTYEERGFITADIYSCKPFDTKTAAIYLRDAFEIASYETQELVRGLSFYDNPLTVRPHLRP